MSSLVEEGGGNLPPAAPPLGGGGGDPRMALMQEMRAQNFDLIRFASYRTASKLRFVQKKVNLHAVDIWNVIEAFRENGLNTLEPQADVSVARLETLLSSLYHSLNKRLPPANQVRAAHCCALLLNWLLAAYCPPGENVGKIRVFSIKVALATMCAGKLMDKLRYIFSQVSDGSGQLMRRRLAEYLREALALPSAVYESPSFPYSDTLTETLFPGHGKVTLNDFMDTMMSDPGPACLVWLPLLHRLASVENVVHPLPCSACGREKLCGFRYRCSRCSHYTLCQDCFWRGVTSEGHTNQHEVKEYTTYKSPSKQIGHSLRKSFRCVPDRARPALPRFPDQPEKTLNLSHIVPPSPVAMHNGFPDSYSTHTTHSGHTGSLDSRAPRPMHHDMGRGDDEHRLIARYAARLAQHNTMPRSARSASLTPDIGRGMVDSMGWSNSEGARAQRELISQLESKNREIMQEIARLRRQQDLENGSGGGGGGGTGSGGGELVGELRALRQRKGELEGHLSALQDSRRHLMGQLEGLMKMLKNQQSSPRSTPTSSPRLAQSPPPSSHVAMMMGPRSAPQTPSLGDRDRDRGERERERERDRMDMAAMAQGLAAGNEGPLSGDMRSNYNSSPRSNGSHNGAPSPAPGNRSLRTDLLFAADSVTNAMSTLVRELNSEGSEEEASVPSNVKRPLDFEEDGDDDEGDNPGGEPWSGELNRRLQRERFLAEVRAREPDPQGGAELAALAAQAAEWEEAVQRWAAR